MSIPAPGDDLAALLAQIEADHEAANPSGANADDPVPLLLGAIGAVLELADDWASERPGETGPGYNATRACGRSIRGAITRRLTRKGDGDE